METMKSLDERLSAMVSPFDESDLTQDELLLQQNFLFEKDSILTSIGTKRARIEFDLHLGDILEYLQEGEELNTFIGECLQKLTSEFYLDVLTDHINRREMIETSPEKILDLIKYFVYEKWLEDIVPCLPAFDVTIFNNRDAISKLITESYLTIQNKIIERDDINHLVRFYFTFCSEEDGIRTILKMVMMDLPGVISVQMVKAINKQETL